MDLFVEIEKGIKERLLPVVNEAVLTFQSNLSAENEESMLSMGQGDSNSCDRGQIY
jgi:hypothetical protein